MAPTPSPSHLVSGFLLSSEPMILEWGPGSQLLQKEVIKSSPKTSGCSSPGVMRRAPLVLNYMLSHRRKDAEALQCRSQLSVLGKPHLRQQLRQEMPTVMGLWGGCGCLLAQVKRLEVAEGDTHELDGRKCLVKRGAMSPLCNMLV